MSQDKPNDIEPVVYAMLREHTGTHFLDSGGASDRHWQRNQAKTLPDFIQEPEIAFDMTVYQQVAGQWQSGRVEDTTEIAYTISVFHYLTQGGLSLDPLCDEFNALSVKDWACEAASGVSRLGEAWLLAHGANFGRAFNSYNWTSALSQVLQGTYVNLAEKPCVLLQIHGGCDVRGGYTDARLFRLAEGLAGYLPPEDVEGVVIRPDQRNQVTQPMVGQPPVPHPLRISNTYDGATLTDEAGHGVTIGPEDQVKLWLPKWS